MLISDRDALQHRCIGILLADRSVHCRAGIGNAIFERRFVSKYACIPNYSSLNSHSTLVYHWATVNAGRYGRIFGWFAGWWNFFAWIFGAASMSSIVANQTVSMYSLFHADFKAQPWHVFVSYMICTWICCATVLFGNKALPALGNIGLFFIISGVFVTIIVCAVMPSVNNTPYASNKDVWQHWTNETGYSDNGFVFVAGMLNGAFAVGSTDCVAHLAEEIPEYVQPDKKHIDCTCS